MSLNILTARLGALGRHEEALEAITEAVRLRRSLASARPDVFGTALARSLNNLADSLDKLGRPDEAETARAEAARFSS